MSKKEKLYYCANLKEMKAILTNKEKLIENPNYEIQMTWNKCLMSVQLKITIETVFITIVRETDNKRIEFNHLKMKKIEFKIHKN